MQKQELYIIKIGGNVIDHPEKLDAFLKLKLFRAISCSQLTTLYLYFDSFKLLDKPELYENLKMMYNSSIKNIPKKIKNGWYNDNNMIPKTICSKAEEKSISNFEAPFWMVSVSKKRFANSGGY